MSIEKFFDTYETESAFCKAPLSEAREALRELIGCDMSAEQYCGLLISFGGHDWVEDLFGELLGELLDIAKQMTDTDGSLDHLALRILFYREVHRKSPGQCKPESYEKFQSSLQKAKEMYCNQYLNTQCFENLIGLAACGEDVRAARLLWEFSGGAVHEAGYFPEDY